MVGKLIAKLLNDRFTPTVTSVILLGESAGNSKFLQILNETLDNVLEDFPTVYSFNPLFVAARRAAEFAHRIQENILLRESDRAPIQALAATGQALDPLLNYRIEFSD